MNLYLNTLPPLGILYLDAILTKEGYTSHVIDANITRYNIDIVKEYDLIGFSLFSSNVESTFEAIKYIRNTYPDKHIIIGGPQCSSNFLAYVDNRDVNAIFIGESEETILRYLEDPCDDNLKGIQFREELDQPFNYNGPAELNTDLDKLPFPSFDKLDLTKYRYYPKKNLPIASIITSRGCPSNCIFCFHNMV